MIRGNALVKDLGFGWINVGVDPFSPCVQCFLKRYQAVHISHSSTSVFDIVPSVIRRGKKSYWNSNQKRISFMSMKVILIGQMKKFNINYSCFLPEWSHQCHVLKINTSLSFHNAPLSVEPSLRTRPALVFTKSTRNGLRENMTWVLNPYKISSVW